MSDSLIERIDRFTALNIGWDGYVGLPVTPMVAEKAKEVVAALTGYTWQAVAGSDGSIQLESHANGLSIEIDISPVL